LALIASEGRLPSAVLAIGAAASGVFGLTVLTVVLALAAAATALFFRDPARSADIAPGDILSPADGRVVFVGRTGRRTHAGDDSLRISVFMSVFNVHVNRVPRDGRVVDVKHISGGFRMAHMENASLENERTEILMEDGQGRKSMMVQVAGLVARRIICRLKPGDEVIAGERFGLICLGSRVDLYLPEGTEIMVKPGDKVRAGISVVGALL